MPLYRASLRVLGAIVVLAIALGCKGKSGPDAASANSVTVSGNVTYLRVPLAKDPSGVPSGLVDATVATNLQSLPARYTGFRIYQQITQTLPDGSTTPAWVVAGKGFTDTSGNYTLTVTKDRPTMVEILSEFNGGGGTIHVLAEPAGINSSTLATSRLQYALRKAADGSAPAGNNAPTSTISANATVNFTVGLNDEWWLMNPAYVLLTGDVPVVTSAVLETTISGRTPGLGTGSRVLGIGDTIASFVVAYSNATPGGELGLHYWPGRSEPRGSYIEYGPYDATHFPQAFDARTGRYWFFGTLQGGPANDDAWDEGVILPLLGRNMLFAGNIGRTFTVPQNPLYPVATALPDLSVDMARLEGLPDAMAANLLKSPYLADTQGTALASPVRDIRDVSALTIAQKTPYSAPAIRAFAWDLILKANSLPSPGAATDWTSINSTAAARFFMPPTSGTVGITDSLGRDLEPLNIYSQLAKLKDTKSSAEPVDLAAVFTDQALTTIGAPFGIVWPRPSTGAYASFLREWGTDPTQPFPAMFLSMAKAAQVNGTYPNISQGEVAYAGFSLTADRRCTLSVTITPALAAGSQLDVDLPRMSRTFSFTGAGGSSPVITIPVVNTPPFYHPVRFRLKNPTAIQPDVSVTLNLIPAP